MVYKQFKELKLSQLGMGNMRLPSLSGETINEAEAQKVIERAYKSGINYFDTAYRYHGGESETFVGKVLKQYPRDSWYLASKMPGHMMRKKGDGFEFTGLLDGFPARSPQEVFEEQLVKCGVDYFDFYLLHNMCEACYDFYTDTDLAIVDYLLEQKKAGRIRHLGISTHGRPEIIDKFLSEYDCIEFVQLQLNYMDWTLQDAKRKYEVVTNHGIPVFVMEPVRGGKLVSLGEDADAALKAARPGESIVSWAFRFLQSLPNVSVVLSGMSSVAQVEENARIFSEHKPLTEAENEHLLKTVSELINFVPCTACRYCCEGCPQSLDIPKLFSLYNEMSNERVPNLLTKMAAKNLSDAELPSACVACGKCAKACPQSIEISDVLKEMSALIVNYRD